MTEPSAYILVIPGTKKAGFLKRVVCLALFTQERVIVAHISNDKITQAVKEAAARAKEAGKGMFARIAAQMGATQALINSYGTRLVEDILADDPANFALETSAVAEVRFKPSKPSRGADDDSSNIPGHLKLRAADTSFDMILDHFEDRGGEARKTLALIFGERVKAR